MEKTPQSILVDTIFLLGDSFSCTSILHLIREILIGTEAIK